MSWIPTNEQKEYLKLIMSMTYDCLAGSGTDTLQTYVNNLENIIDCISKKAKEEL